MDNHADDYKLLDDAQLDALIAKMRAEKDDLQVRLREAVLEHDRRETTKKIARDFPGIGRHQVVKPVGIPSQEQVGRPGGS